MTRRGGSREKAGALALALAAALLTGCAAPVPPASAPPPVLPTAWQGGAASLAGAAPGEWWLQFHDPLLASLVGRALVHSPAIASARAVLMQARATRDIAAAGLAIGVSGNASVQRSKSGSSDSNDNYSAGFDASWEADLYGGRHASLDAGAADVGATRLSLADAQVALAAEVGLQYLAVRAAQGRLAIARENLASEVEIDQITGWRVQAGLLTSLEGEQARAALEQAAAQLPPLLTAQQQASHALAVLCGANPASLEAELAAPAGLPELPAALTLSLPAETLRQRADVRAAEFRLSAARARVSAADAARYPSFKLQGSLGLRGLAIGAGGVSTSLLSAMLGSLSGNAFDGGAARAQVRLQQGALAQSEAAYRSAVLTALQEVEDALSALGGDRERLARLRNASLAASNAALLARQRYTSGLVDFQTVLETQRTLYSAQDGVAQTGAALAADHVRLYKALGGGWQPEANDANPDESVSTPARAP